MKLEVSLIKQKIQASLAKLAASLVRKNPALYPQGSLGVGVWSNPQGIVCGWISYHPHHDPSEECIDMVIYIQRKGEGLVVSIDIAWSNGAMLEEIADIQFERDFEEDIPLVIENILNGEMNNAASAFEGYIRQFFLTEN